MLAVATGHCAIVRSPLGFTRPRGRYRAKPHDWQKTAAHVVTRNRHSVKGNRQFSSQEIAAVLFVWAARFPRTSARVGLARGVDKVL